MRKEMDFKNCQTKTLFVFAGYGPMIQHYQQQSTGSAGLDPSLLSAVALSEEQVKERSQ